MRAGSIDGIPTISMTFGNVAGLPDPEIGTFLVVSAIVARAAWAMGRRDVVTVGDPVRDDEGRIVGAASLCVCPEHGDQAEALDGYRAEALYSPPLPAIVSPPDMFAGENEALAETNIPAAGPQWKLRLFDEHGNTVAARSGWACGQALVDWAEFVLSIQADEDYM